MSSRKDCQLRSHEQTRDGNTCGRHQVEAACSTKKMFDDRADGGTSSGKRSKTVRAADSKSTTSNKALVSDEETAIVLAQPARFASKETMRGFRVYIAHRVAQITDMAQEYVNILGADKRLMAFNAQFEARHERVVMWRDNYDARHTFPDMGIEPSDEQEEAYKSDPDFATVIANMAFWYVTETAQYARRWEFGWISRWGGDWTNEVALPLVRDLRTRGVTDPLLSYASTRSAYGG